MTSIDLETYLAQAPAETQDVINLFLAVCRQVQDAHDDQQRRARLTLAIRHADTLRGRRDALEQLLRDGDVWLTEHPNPDDEARWFAAETEYRAIWDALREGARIAFGSIAPPEQVRLLGVV